MGHSALSLHVSAYFNSQITASLVHVPFFFFFFLMSEMIYLSRFTGVIKQSSEEDLYHGPST